MKAKYALPFFGLLCCVITPGYRAFAQDGALDLSFNTTGKMVKAIGTFDDDIYAVAMQSDNKIVVAGHSHQGSHYVFAVARFNTDGSPDNTFDGDGVVQTTFDAYDAKAKALVIQSDGKIVVAGLSNNGSVERFAVARYNTNGSLDNTFDGDGKATTIVGTGYSSAHSVTINGDGKILAGGFGTNGAYTDFAIVCYNPDGSLDNSFDGDGIVMTDVGTKNDIGNSIAIQSDGYILLSGYAQNISDNDFAVVRYLKNGSLDNTFDTDGKVLTKIVGTFNEYANAMVVQPDKKIIVAGGTNSTFHDFVLARYNEDGSLDNSFDADGVVYTDFGTSVDKGEAIGMSLQNDGKIVVAGNVTVGSTMNFGVLKYKTDGTLDSTFDSDGLVTTSINNDDGARSVAIQSDGKIVAAGGSYDGSQKNFAIARYKNTVESGAGIKGSSKTSGTMKIFPNPITNKATLQSGNVLNNAELRLYNGFGQLVYTQKNISGTEAEFINPGLPDGQYWLHLVQNGNTLAREQLFICSE